MTVKTFHNHKYSTWNIDLSHLKLILDEELNQAFENPKNLYSAPEKIGEGMSLLPKVMPNMNCFNKVYDYIKNQITSELTKFDIPFYYQRKKLSLIRCWANRTYYNTQGAIHNHKDHTVLVIYYNVPKHSGDLIFIDPKHSDKILKKDDLVPEVEKLKIKVDTGLCVLHDGRILHAVSQNGSVEPRDVLIFEFDKIF